MERAYWRSILELERFTPTDVNRTASVRTSLLLVLFLGESFASGHGQVTISTIGVFIALVRIADVAVGGCFRRE